MREDRGLGVRTLLCVVVCAAGLVVSGCLQVDVTIEMQDEGGALITERLRFSAELQELDHGKPAEQQMVRLLERAAVDERAKQMGKGVTVASHEVSTLRDGSRESVTVYSIPEVEDLRLVNPYLHESAPARVMRIKFEPIYRVVHSFHALGEMMVYLVPAEQPKRSGVTGEERPRAPTPADLQMVRDVSPVFADLFKGFEVRLRLVYPKPISYGAIRDRQSGSRVIDFISFTDRDLDAYGRRFVENEELMLSLLRLQFDAENITDHTQGFAGNSTVPVFRGRKPYACGLFRVKPTRSLFQKYFAGRPKSQGGDAADPPGK